MKDRKSLETGTMKKRGGRFFPALCRILGTVILLAVILVCLPLAAPRLMGYDVFAVVSGSMDPYLPMGSIVFVTEVAPEEVEPGTVIAFYREADVIIHRVTSNSLVLGHFTTKGDANQSEDIEEVPYQDLIGKVVYHLPEFGRIYLIFSTKIGKIYMAILAACGLMFHMLASQMRESRKQ